MLNASNLYKYQRVTADHIIKNPYCGVFLDMGLGKTVSTLTAIEALAFDALDIQSVLIVAPKRVAENTWTSELKRWTHLQHLTAKVITGTPKQRWEAVQSPALIHIISRDNLKWLVDTLRRYNQLNKYDMLVLDELSSFKNSNSQRFKACKHLRANAKRTVGLTGTIIPNGYLDLYTQMYLIDGGKRLGRTKTEYISTYFYPKAQNGHIVFSYGMRKGAEETIKNKIKDICISMTKTDYLDLPPCRVVDREVHLSKKEMDLYKSLARDAVATFDGIELTAMNMANLSNTLTQLSGGAVYTQGPTGERIAKEIHTAKLETLCEIVEASSSPVLIAYNFIHEYERIKEALKAYKPITLDTSKAIDEWNKGLHHVAIGHPASIGHGLNIQHGGNTIVWFSLAWSLELYQQFNARLHRQGQTKPVTIYRLITKGTIDERIAEMLGVKGKTQDGLMQDLKAYIDDINLF